MRNYFSARNLKKAVTHFFIGKSISAVANFAIMLLIVRMLNPNEYAAYVVFLGSIMFVQMFSSLGFNSAALRFIPELIVKNEWQIVKKFVYNMLFIRVIALATMLLCFIIWEEKALAYIGLPHNNDIIIPFILATFCIVLFRFSIILMESMQKQKATKWLSIGLSLLRFLFISTIWLDSKDLDIVRVIEIEFISHLILLFFAIIFLVRIFHAHASDHDVHISSFYQRIFPFCSYNYLMTILTTTSSRAADKLIAVGVINTVAMATFGLCISLLEQVQRYLPSFLLRNLVQPVVIARYAESSDKAQLVRNANIMYKLNVFSTLPIFIFSILCGDEFISFISGNKYNEAGVTLSLLVVVSVLWSKLDMLELLVNAVERNKEIFIATIIDALFIIPAVYFLYNHGIYGLLISRIVGSIVKNIYLTHQLRAAGLPMHLDYGLLRMYLFATSISIALYSFLPHPLSIIQMTALGISICIVFYGILILIKSFSSTEREIINRLIGKNYFIW